MGCNDMIAPISDNENRCLISVDDRGMKIWSNKNELSKNMAYDSISPLGPNPEA